MKLLMNNWSMFVLASLLLRRSAAWQTTFKTALRPPRSTTSSSITSLPSSSALFSSTKAASSEEQKATEKKCVPITLLSGFLGTGKTTALKHLLENKNEVKIGVIVNDVAEVNIDAKLITSQSDDGIVELQNGCACCSLADELFFSVDSMLQNRDLDAIVVELSGVADPKAIRNNWLMAPEFVKNKADIHRVVTILDAASFGTDYMSWDDARERKGWLGQGEQMTPAATRKVAELLAEQVEAADLILLNKIDLAEDEDQIQVAQKVAQALNEDAVLERVEFGSIDPSMVLGTVKEAKNKKEKDVCNEPDCTDNSHAHSHSHDCSEPDCTDAASHSHSHDHDCNEPGCTDASHSHSHDHEDATCNDPTCTDTSHSHSHNHGTSVESLGMVNMVFRSTRPFDPVKLMNVLNRWPVPVKDVLDLESLKNAQEDGYEIGGKPSDEDSPFLGVLRSKGFCWFAPNKWTGANADAWRHDTAMYWSHAGKSFSLMSAGKWWATLDKERMKAYFVSNEKEYERVLAEDFVSEEFGDRRQEIVFIGVDLNKKVIVETLEDCLYTEEELEQYRQELRNYLDAKSKRKSTASLFNMGGVDHTEG